MKNFLHNQTNFKMNDRLYEFGTNSSMHGVQFICNKSTTFGRRVVWLQILFGTVFTTMYLLVNTIIKFTSYGSVISYKKEYLKKPRIPIRINL